jgi:hypothetical protein
VRPTPAVLLACVALVLGMLAPAARADLAPYRVRTRLTVRSVTAVEVSAPVEDRDAALARVHEGLSAFLPRIERCIGDHGAGLGSGRVRARLRYERSELPTRARIVENQLDAAIGACVREILPSLVVRPAPRGELTIEVTFGVDHRITGRPPRRAPHPARGA